MENEVKDWFDRAKKDLSSAKYNLEGKKYYLVAFLCQQALEKGFKALWLKEKKTTVPRVHDLVFFFKRLNIPDEFLEICEDISSSYIQSRYPTGIEAKFTKKEVEDFLRKSGKILKWIKEKL